MQPGDDQQFLAVTRTDGLSAPGIGDVPPGATVILLHRNCLADVLAQQLRGGDSDNAGGPVVNVDDEGLFVGDHQPVGVVVTYVSEPPGGTLDSRSFGPLSHNETLSNTRAFLHTRGLI